jgi:prepilin-type N-terminal cleavage/methylation domain-containing protein|tara:strand:+ start:76 stop:528 length:453 start_codon:yes stop_codon:yes gene_type:complete
MKKGFTLIELLIVVAIIGILAGVGVPMYNGYMTDAKINSTKENHLRIKSFISSQLIKCTVNSSGKMILGTKSHRCDGNPYSQARDFYDYFNGEGGFRNPYEKDKAAVKVAKNPLVKGETAIVGGIANPSFISIKTKIDDSTFLSDIIFKE